MLTQKRILVIDDEVRMCESLKSLLMPWGYFVETATSGREGIEKLKQDEFQVVVTDIKMEDVSGYDVMAFIQEQHPETPVIAITGHASTESAVEAMHYTVFDYITKPFEFDSIRMSIERAFAKVEASTLRNDLISMITHDIKVPLTSIIGYSSLIYNKKTKELHPKAREYADTISAGAQKILELVDNFLTTCKYDAGKLGVPNIPVQLSDVLEDLMSVLELQAEKANLEIRMDIAQDLPPLRGDEHLIFRALSNVISNAIQYAGGPGWIEISACRLMPEESPLGSITIRIDISNSGQGVAPEDLPHIFDRFERSSEHSGGMGAGLGLYAVKCICEAHDAIVRAKSAPGERTTFSFFLQAYQNISNEI